MTKRSSETVAKAIRLLDAFSAEDDRLSLTQLAAKIGLHKTTVLRYANTLEAGGLLRRGADRAYRLGPKLWQLGALYKARFHLEELVRPHLARLAEATGESASFYVRDGDKRICLFRQNSPHQIRHHVDEGTELSVLSGVVGPVLLAFSGEPGAEYERIRTQGGLAATGREPDTASVSVPVLTHNRTLLGALVVSGPATRFRPAEQKAALEALKAAAAAIADRFDRGSA